MGTLTSGYLLNTDLSDWALEEKTSIILFSSALLSQVVKRGAAFDVSSFLKQLGNTIGSIRGKKKSRIRRGHSVSSQPSVK